MGSFSAALHGGVGTNASTARASSPTYKTNNPQPPSVTSLHVQDAGASGRRLSNSSDHPKLPRRETECCTIL